MTHNGRSKTTTQHDALTSIRLRLFQNGYHPILCHGKVPAMAGWNSTTYVTEQLHDGPRGKTAERIESWRKRFSQAVTTGVRIEGGLLVIDIDVDDFAAVEALLMLIAAIAPQVAAFAPTRYGGGEKMALFCRVEGEDFIRIASHKYRRPVDGVDKYHAVEIFGGRPFRSGVCSRQFAIYGPRSYDDNGVVTSAYVWAEGVPELADVKLADLPTFSKAQAYAIAAAFEEWAKAAGWILVAGLDEGDGEGRDVYDIDRDLSRFEVQHVGEVSYAELEAVYFDNPDIRCTANFIAGEQSTTADRCSVFWSTRHDCIVVKDWKTAARHYPADVRAGPATEGVAEAIRGAAADAGVEIDVAALFPAQPTVDDFYAFLPSHQYICRHDGAMWLQSGVNTTVARVAVGVDEDGVEITIPAYLWLDRNRGVWQMTWVPGKPQLIHGLLAADGGWIEKEGVAVFNKYRAPVRGLGDVAKAAPWLRLIGRIYPDHVDHILAFCAHRIQRPAEKINHALVLTGCPGIGKDTLLEPLKRGVGEWNFREISPQDVTGNNNDFMQSVVLRVSETRDLGETNRYSFYEATKTMIAAPPDMVRVNVKYLPQFYVPNVTAVVFTTNYPADGLYLPPDDRRHYVCGSEATQASFEEGYFAGVWDWYAAGGVDDVVAFLAGYDLSLFDAKAPPEKTPAFWRMVDTGRPVEEPGFRDALAALGNPDALTIPLLMTKVDVELSEWMRDLKNRRNVPRRLDDCGYVPVRNVDATDGRWKINGKGQMIYVKKTLDYGQRYAAAAAVKKREEEISGQKW